MRCATALSACALAACAGLPPVPSKGGPAWRELESEHFVLRTDLSSDRAHETIRQMEHLLAGLLRVGWEVRGSLPAKLTVVMFADRSHRKVFSPYYDGWVIQRRLEGPVAVMAAARRFEGSDTLVHELTHEIAYLAMERQPTWFSEGIATFFQTAKVEPDGTFVIGDTPWQYAAVGRAEPLPAATLMAADADLDDERFYGSAWLLVHFLMMRHADAFVAYQEALARGERFEDAWRSTLGALTPDKLDDALDEYRYHGAFPRMASRVPAPQVHVRERSMTDADVYALRALLYARCRDCGHEQRELARRNVALALQADPNHVDALLAHLDFVRARDEALVFARRAVAADPKDWRAWLALAIGLMPKLSDGTLPQPEWGAAIDRAVELGPKQPIALGMAALRAHFSGDDVRALELSRQAVRKRPTDKAVLGLRLMVLLLAHRCDELPDVAVRFAHAQDSDFTREEIDRLRTTCEQEHPAAAKP